MKWVGVVALGIAPGCNFVLGNEDGVLEDLDAWPVEPPADGSMNDPDAQAERAPDADDAGNESETSTTDPDATVVEPDASLGDADASIVADASVTDATADRVVDASTDARPSDAKADGDASSCETGVSLCAVGQTGMEMQACGPCGRGVQTRTRTCAPGGCAWGAWSAWGACSAVTVECMPGQTGSESQACGPCNTGTQARSRACTASCTWGAWGAFGACGNITAECQPDHWRCCAAGSWEWCYTNRCMWTGGCAPCTNCGC